MLEFEQFDRRCARYEAPVDFARARGDFACEVGPQRDNPVQGRRRECGRDPGFVEVIVFFGYGVEADGLRFAEEA